MTVRRLRKNQRGPWCGYCEPKTTRATHRGLGFSKFSCADHKERLETDDREYECRDSIGSDAEFSLPDYV